MITEKQIETVIRNGIQRFERPYQVPANRIQLVFALNEEADVRYIMCVDHEPKNTVTLRQLIGWNIYNGIVHNGIRDMLKKIADVNNIPQQEIKVMAFYEEPVRLMLTKKDSTVRQVTAFEIRELLN